MYPKEYYINNKEKILLRTKEYNQKLGKVYISNYNKNYYKKNKFILRHLQHIRTLSKVKICKRKIKIPIIKQEKPIKTKPELIEIKLNTDGLIILTLDF